METIFNVIGSKTYKNLLADPKGADLITVPVYPNVSALSAGALLTRNSAGLWEPIASANIGRERNVAKDVTGSTAPMSSGDT